MECILPEWATHFAIDPDGTLWLFEGDPFFEGGRWNPLDDYDGLNYRMVGRLTTTSGGTPLTFSEDTAALLSGPIGECPCFSVLSEGDEYADSLLDGPIFTDDL